MRVEDFDFDLPKNRIAQVPAHPRDSARLLHIGERLADHLVRDLPSLLRSDDILVLNDTKVIPARIAGQRTADRGTAKVEITLHQNIIESNDVPAQWRVFAKPGRKLKPGDIIEFNGVPRATVLDKRQTGDILLAFDCTTTDLLERLQVAGEMPVPPYISRTQPVPEDRRDYQTIYARKPGAVAAPTAGLHFTEELFAALEDRGIAHCFVTL
ncbi:MAG: S-adenosylmethionine:tRNA ribosyltransferase-isomerase, partial [Rhodospirillaceae bacterium]|nr:S-adenosylmethionine:tRNA ribosyltransferase-isomerase [Rhodospirillaceae bacterium]